MARKPKPEDPPPSKAYLVSFGDTMTALLAFFIVLLSLADDQSGMNMHTGTGSFVKATDGLGLPGAFSNKTSKLAVQQEHLSPLYLAPNPEEPDDTDSRSRGPDEEDNRLTVADREEENFKRFLNELGRFSAIDQLPLTSGEAVFDIFNRLNREPPYLAKAHREALTRALPVLLKPDYRLDVIVWATMPSQRRWTDAAQKAVSISDEITQWASLTEDQQRRLKATGKPWKYADVKRPVLSIVIRKTTPMSGGN